jgi:hypothetical protein
MSVSINGDNGLTFNDGSSQASAQVGMKNRLIDAGFTINQRVYVSGTSLASGVYAHDRWKAGSGGCTYTFTQGSLGVPITITITAGSLQQVIEGCNIPEGGTYTLLWSGTAQAKVNGGSYAASPITVTGLTAGANCTVEFGTGTVTKPQFEVGSTATSFDYRPYGTELALCQRYYEKSFAIDTAPANGVYSMGYIGYVCFADQWVFAAPTILFKITKRATPTIAFFGTSTNTWQINDNNNSWINYAAVSTGFQGSIGIFTTGFSAGVHNNGNSGYAIGSARMIRGDWTASSEL